MVAADAVLAGVVARAGAPYAGEVAIAVRFSATTGSASPSAAVAAGGRGAFEAFPPSDCLPLPVGTISTYWEIAEAGPSSAAAGCAIPRMPPTQTRHPMPT